MARILVVDDEVGIRELLSEILYDEGHTVDVAENAMTARALRAQFKHDLVLLDIWMPDTDGVTLLKEWSSAGLLTMPVVMMSGHATIDTAVEATRIGAADFLEKPITLQKLLVTVRQALERGLPPARVVGMRNTVGRVAARPANAGTSYLGSSVSSGALGVSASSYADDELVTSHAQESTKVFVSNHQGATPTMQAHNQWAAPAHTARPSPPAAGYHPSYSAAPYSNNHHSLAENRNSSEFNMARPGQYPAAQSPQPLGMAHIVDINGHPSLQVKDLPLDLPLREARDAFERVYFEYHLQREDRSMTRVADRTGLERTHLYRKLKQLGIPLGKRLEKRRI